MRDNLVIPVRGPNLTRRFLNLVTGEVLFGLGIGLMIHSELGVPPWDVLHQGLAERFGLTVGIWSIVVSVVVLAAWLPLREPYGVGTILNALIIGAMIDISSLFLPRPELAAGRIGMVAGGIVVVALGSGLYIGADLGPGPRDGLMTGIAARGPSIRLTRTAIEVSVLVVGWMLGGTFGVGTVAFAVFIGPLVQFFLPRLHIDTLVARRSARGR
ncbi:MAG: YczE/YyaS/YitT family protein [Actinomycetota bacterium]